MWNFSDLSIWVQSKFAQASLQVTCYGDSNLSVTEKPVWSRGAPSTSSWMPEKNTSILLLLLGFQTNWALDTFPGDTERMRIPKRLGVVTLVQAHPCWVQWDQHSALLCIQLCLKLQSSTKSCGNVQGSDWHLLSSLSQEKCDSQMGEQQRAWSEDAVSARKFPSSCSSHCNHSSVPMGALRKYQPLSVEVERIEKPPALTQHCHHPQNRWRCTQATQTLINL